MSPNVPVIQVTDASTPFPILAPGQPRPKLNNVPGGAHVWVVGSGGWFVVYDVPGTNPPVPMVWAIRDPDQMKAIFGDQAPVADRYLTNDEFYRQSGALRFGYADELANRSEHPFDTFVADFERTAAVQPWLRDPEVLALTTMAILEGRSVSEAELQSTNWWRTRTEGQRQWLSLYAGDPATAQQKLQDNRIAVRAAFTKAGASAVDDSLVNLIADRWTMGEWSQAKMLEQVAKAADPYAAGVLDGDISALLKNKPLSTFENDSEAVRQMVMKWIGPAFGKQWSSQQLSDWAGKVRNDPSGGQALLTQELQRQRLALFPEYQNIDLTYEDIAAPWKATVRQVWGQQADESDPLFVKLIRTNDLAANEQALRNEGLKRGIGKVVTDALDATQALGGTVRRAI